MDDLFLIEFLFLIPNFCVIHKINLFFFDIALIAYGNLFLTKNTFPKFPAPNDEEKIKSFSSIILSCK